MVADEQYTSSIVACDVREIIVNTVLHRITSHVIYRQCLVTAAEQDLLLTIQLLQLPDYIMIKPKQSSTLVCHHQPQLSLRGQVDPTHYQLNSPSDESTHHAEERPSQSRPEIIAS